MIIRGVGSKVVEEAVEEGAGCSVGAGIVVIVFSLIGSQISEDG